MPGSAVNDLETTRFSPAKHRRILENITEETFAPVVGA